MPNPPPWPAEVQKRAVELYLAGTPKRTICRIIADETGRPCHHSTAARWVARAGAYRPEPEFQWQEAQKVTLALLRASPLSLSELVEIRGNYLSAVHRTLALLTDRGFVFRRGATRRQCAQNRSRQVLFHWTGKPFPDPGMDMAEGVRKAMEYQSRCEYRMSLIAQHTESAA